MFANLFVSMFLFFLVLVVLDVLAGAVHSYLEGEFDIEELPGFLITAGAYTLAWALSVALAQLPELLDVTVEGYTEAVADVLPNAIFALIVLKYVSSIVGHIRFFIGYQGEE